MWSDVAFSEFMNPLWNSPSLATPSYLDAWSITRNSAKKIGICRISGRHEANGLVPVSFHSFICSCVRRSRSCLYFCWSALICGCSSCMLRLDLICLTNSGIRSVRIVTVRPTIDSAHVQPLFSGSTVAKILCQTSRIPDTA